jgi:hypothetical protein
MSIGAPGASKVQGATGADVASESALRVRHPTEASAKRWRLPHYLAVLALPLMVNQAWTLCSWLADGPHQVTEYRERDSVSWYAAHTLEAAVCFGSIFVIAHLVRGCRREGRILTFDVMWCICWGTSFYLNYSVSFIQPVFSISSNFVNLNNPCGHMPLVVNPDCGRAVDAPLFWWPVEAFMFLVIAKWMAKQIGRLRQRQPHLSTGQVLGYLIGFSMALALLELVPLALGLWAYGGPRWMSLDIGPGAQFNLFIWVETALTLAAMGAVFTFRDDNGLHITERHLKRHTARVRTTISFLAMYSTVNLIFLGPGTLPMATVSYFQDGWPKLPAHLVNGICDAPGFAGTRYGPCPGSPGWRAPVRHSLPGESP